MGLWAAGLVLGSPVMSLGAGPDAPEVGHYSFAAFAAGTQDEQSLPPELRRPATAGLLPTAMPASEQTVEITWEAREPFGFGGYRVTTLMEGAGLGPVIARWTVDPWSGASGANPGQRRYRLRLPVLASGAVRLRTTLEALRPLGPPVLLAVRESLASPAGEAEGLDSSQPSRLVGGTASIAALPQRETVAETARGTERCAAGRPQPRARAQPLGSGQPHVALEPRGPPFRIPIEV